MIHGHSPVNAPPTQHTHIYSCAPLPTFPSSLSPCEVFQFYESFQVKSGCYFNSIPFIHSTTWFVLHLLTGSITSAIEETLLGLSVVRNLVVVTPKAEPPPPSPPPPPCVLPALLHLSPQPEDSLLIKAGYTGPGPVTGVPVGSVTAAV